MLRPAVNLTLELLHLYLFINWQVFTICYLLIYFSDKFQTSTIHLFKKFLKFKNGHGNGNGFTDIFAGKGIIKLVRRYFLLQKHVLAILFGKLHYGENELK